MHRKPDGGKTVWIVVVAALLVFGVLLAAFLSSSKGNARDTIQLPDGGAAQPAQPEPPDVETLFLQVNRENIQQTLKTLQRPEAYYQSLSVEHFWEGGSGTERVEIWRAGTRVCAQIAQTGRTRHVLSDGVTAWVWYDADTQAVSYPLDGGRTLDEVIGVASFETVLAQDAAKIQAAGFLTATEGSEVADCLYLQMMADERDYRQTFWVDVATQLLWRAETEQGGEPVYRLRQTAFARLEPTDPALVKRFTLPGGQTITAK